MIGEVLVLSRNKFVAGDLSHGVEDSLIADAALAQLCVHHTDPQLAEFFVR
jgi:hypothetical protein